MIDTEGLLREISPDDPCGDDLEYDPAYGALERAAQGKAEQQIGDTVVPAEPPEWADVRAKALGLFERTKDLRVALHLTRALARTEGWTGFRDGLVVVKGLLERYWDGVHPRLDPDDDNDPTLRVNVIAELCDPDAMLDGLRLAPLVASRALGSYSLRDVQIASGELSAPRDSKAPPPETALIDAALREADLEQLQATADATSQTIEMVAGIESLLMERVGSSAAPDLAPLTDLAKAAHKVLATPLSERAPTPQAVSDATSGEAEMIVPGQAAPGPFRSRGLPGWYQQP